MTELIRKYNTAVPRYTSYPTVPYWGALAPTAAQWLSSATACFNETNDKDGISLYIHLPFCESLCTYCACNTRITINHQVESPYITAVLKEWELYLRAFGRKPRIREIHLGGGTPTFFSVSNLKMLIEGILSGAEKHERAEFSFEAHPANTTQEHIQTLFTLGFRRISFGIQDFSPKVQEIINRKQSFSDVEKAVDEAKKAGYSSINFDLIYGLPLQTRASIIDTMHKVNNLRPHRIAFYSYAHVPWVKPGQRKFTEADLPVDEEKCALYGLGREMLTSSGYQEIGMDHFALETDSLYKAKIDKTLHRNFMGYTHNYTRLSIGLGVSSISDSWTAFVQNTKSVEEYQRLIAQGELPLLKGHLLTQEDKILRKHILNIMCLFETSWPEGSGECEALSRALERLRPLEADRLVALRPSEVKVTKKGRSFLRNVCMAFDERLWCNTPAAQIFSTAV